jgi:hypothetical protein
LFGCLYYLVVWLFVLLVVCAAKASTVIIEEVVSSDEASVITEDEAFQELLPLTDLSWKDAEKRHSVALRCVLYC